MRSLRLLTLIAALAGLGSAVAFAQYPAPGGNILLVPSNPTPSTNSTVNINVTVRDAAGQPIGAANCTAAVSAQPGSGASVVPASFQTSAAGAAALTVQTGASAGEVRVQVTCGTVSAAGVLQVTAPGTAPSPSVVPGPPNTGTGENEAAAFPIELVVVASLILLTGVAVVGYQRRRVS